MLTNEPMTQTTTPTQEEPIADGPVIVAPGAPGAVVQATTSDHHAENVRTGIGAEGEETVWEGHYSGRNFIGRMIFGGLLVALWIYLFVSHWRATQGGEAGRWSFWSIMVGIVVVAYWANLGYRYVKAYRGHHYRLTNRRLFVTTGFFRRRVDQLELLRVDDVYIQQSMVSDWLNIGHVVVISSERTLPKAFLLGVDDPRRVMDLIWHHMRTEQQTKTNEVHPV